MALKGRPNPSKGIRRKPHLLQTKEIIKVTLKTMWARKRKEYILRWKLGLETGKRKNANRLHRQVVIYILAKYNYTCCKCGWHELNPSSHKCPVEINHRDGDRCNCSEGNLEVLCPNCHSLTRKYRNHGGARYIF